MCSFSFLCRINSTTRPIGSVLFSIQIHVRLLWNSERKTLILFHVKMSSLASRTILGFEVMFLKSTIRKFSSFVRPNELPNLPGTMSAWQLYGYKGLESLKLVSTVEVPPITQPNEVLVKIKAASINSLDVMMSGMPKIKILLNLGFISVKYIYRGIWSATF